MKLDRLIMAIVGAALGSLVAIWWVRKNGFPALPVTTHTALEGDTPDYIPLD